MIFHKTTLEGAYLIDLEPIRDHRGWFADSFCEIPFEDHDLESRFVRSAMSFNHSKYTLRGMHKQKVPHEEAKLVRCIQGSIYDVIIDLRPESPTYIKWEGFYLNEENRQMLFVPEGFAHGYLTLEVDSEVFYQISEHYNERAQMGLRWNDPVIGIEWPTWPSVISVKDQAWEDYKI